ncbi:S8 family serine peptidase [Rossellomorea sp. FM04394]|uniref:S8 family serine peptidase n=1 Tax=Rossellomorea sp. FM04394 TaxID=3243076 RepID=UPI0035A6883C
MKDISKKVVSTILTGVLAVGLVAPASAASGDKKTENYKKMSKEFSEQQVMKMGKPAKIADFKEVKVKKPVKASSENKKHKKDEVIVKFKGNVVHSTKTEIAGVKLEKKEKLTKKGVGLYKLSSGQSVEEAISMLKKSPDVLYAEPNYELTASDVNDPYFSSLWGLKNTGQYINQYGTPGIDINVSNAWDITMGSTSTVIAVIDTGIDINHPDLKYRIFTNKNEVPNNGIDDDNNGYVDDVNGWDFYNEDNTVYDSPYVDDHGTHVAGTIAGHSDNGIGVVGVAPNVKILPLKFLGTEDGSGYTSDAVRAVEYAASMGIKISNNSWGGSGYSTALYEAIRDSNSLFIAAAGNDGSNIDYYSSYPAGYDLDNILSVAAVDNRGDLAYFSNYGRTSVDVAAPGVSILSSLPDNSYGYYNGTSMATPHVAGVAALIQSEYPDYDPSTMKTMIMDSTKELSSVDGITVTGGMVDAGRALGSVPDDDIPGIAFNGPEVYETLDAETDRNDVYSIELQKGQEISARLINGSYRDFDLYLYNPYADTVDSSKGIVAYSEKTGNAIDSFKYVAPYTGTYYVNAYGFEGKGSYKLEVSVSGAKPGNYQDTHGYLMYEGLWNTFNSSYASGGKFTVTNDDYSSVEMTFEGNGIEYFGKKDSSSGIAKVTIDNSQVYYVDLYSANAGHRQKLFSKTGLSNGTHTIKIEWTGTSSKSGKKTATSINVDYLKVLGN